MKKTAISCLFFMLMGMPSILAQQAVPRGGDIPSAPSATSKGNPDNDVALQRLMLANSSMNYPVTPSDRYTLTYTRSAGTGDRSSSSGDIVAKTIQVASDYSVDLGLFGKINAKGLTFLEVKAKVEALVAESYSRSYPSLMIESVGMFRVNLGGAISQPRAELAWGLSRVSDLLDRNKDPKLSIRTIKLTSFDGQERYCDLLMGMRMGDDAQDPIVHPGDSITLSPASTMIEVKGAVRFPGDYEILGNEGLQDLIEKFAGGMLDEAEPSRVRIDSLSDNGAVSHYVNINAAYAGKMDLTRCFSVAIPSKMDKKSFVWFEGAVNIPSGSETQSVRSGAGARPFQAEAGETNRISVPIYEGEMLSDVVHDIKNAFSAAADLKSATLFRGEGGWGMPVDLQPMLASTIPPIDIKLQQFDRIFIPVAKSTISVYGAVFNGGMFPYQPNVPASYYINLAGGNDPERNKNGHYVVYDQSGKKKSSKAPLMPNDRIYVPINNLTYNIVRYTPVVSGLVTLAIVVAQYVSK